MHFKKNKIMIYSEIKEIEIKVENLKKQVSNNKNKETLINILNLIDLTTLSVNDTIEKVKLMVEKVNNFNKNFPNYKNVAAICVYPSLISTVKKNLVINNVSIASVGAGFPASQTFLSIKAAECELAVNKGADEVDIVISVGDFLSKRFEKVAYEIGLVKNSIDNAKLKVILETGELLNLENIYIASILSMESGGDFIKTSTGKTDISATPEAVFVMCYAIKEYYEKTGKKIGIKPSGGIKTSEDAILYYLIVKEILGEDWLNNKLFRFGASSLANNILSNL